MVMGMVTVMAVMANGVVKAIGEVANRTVATMKLQPVPTILPLIRLSLPEFLLQFLPTAMRTLHPLHNSVE